MLKSMELWFIELRFEKMVIVDELKIFWMLLMILYFYKIMNNESLLLIK